MSEEAEKSRAVGQVIQSVANESGGREWVLLPEGEIQGLSIIVDHTTGDVILLSTRDSKDSERWKDDMPSLQAFTSARELDLHGSRYIRTLHGSVCSLVNLKRLKLTKCDRLEKLPDSLGNLQRLEEVRLMSR